MGVSELIESISNMIKKIEEQFATTSFKNLNVEITRSGLEELWKLVPTLFEWELEDIEIISVNRTFKLIFKDVPPIKALQASKVQYEALQLVHKNGVNVVSPISIDEKTNWQFVEWIDGEVYRLVLNKLEVLHSIKPSLWFKLGELLGKVNSIPWGKEGMRLGVFDALWWNFVITKDEEVYLIDTKKFIFHIYPEKYIFWTILFHEYILPEQLLSFVNGYLSSIDIKEDLAPSGFSMMEATKLFANGLYGKLARK